MLKPEIVRMGGTLVEFLRSMGFSQVDIEGVLDCMGKHLRIVELEEADDGKIEPEKTLTCAN